MTQIIGKLYEKLWRKVGGKPWTENSPLIYLLIFLGLGILVAKLAGKYWWQILVGFLLGILCGHFWW
jgi:hypothetical protein